MTPSCRTILRTALPFMLTAALLAGTAVRADDATRSDPREMGEWGLDIETISQGHFQRPSDGRWRLVHTITTHQKWRSRELRCESRFDLHIKDNGRSVDIIYRDGGLRARVENARGHLVGRAYATRSDERSVTVRIRPRHLGRVGRSYEWRASASTSGCGCNDNGGASSCPVVIDVAPDRGYVTHRRDLD